MFIYYKQKEIDDLKKVDSINATLAKAVEGVSDEVLTALIGVLSYLEQ